MPRFALRAYALAAVALSSSFLVLCMPACSSSTSSADDPCKAASDCCATLRGAGVDTCNQQVSAAKQQNDSASACGVLLNGYHASGLCNGGGSVDSSGSPPHGVDGGVIGPWHDGGAASDGSPNGAQSPICERYVHCATQATPASAAAVIAAYGPSGTCWSSTPAVANDCTSACVAGIAQLHNLAPSACPICLGDNECSGATPACNVSAGECVACMTDAQCPSGACDTSKHRCVACNKDADCKDSQAPVCDLVQHTCAPGCVSDANCTSPSAPHCDAPSHQCVECTTSAQCTGAVGSSCDPITLRCGCTFPWDCPGGGVCASGGTCCTPKKCPAGACGSMNDGCGNTIDCGTCARGTCSSDTNGNNTCSTAGSACTPGPGACLGTERCLPDRTTHAYVCAPDEEGQQCLASSSGDCNFLTGHSVDTYTCAGGSPFGKCAPYCVTNGDCAGTATCHPFGSGPISLTNPGVCD
jgi:hypothetical protein